MGLAGKLGLVVLAALIALAGWTYWRIASTPDLGAPPQGPAHGSNDAALAAYTITSLLGLISPIGSAHQTVTLSEQDLTTIAREKAGTALSNPQVRVRDGKVVVSGGARVVGIGVTAVGHLELQLVTGADGIPDISATIDEIDAGQLTLPGVLRAAIADKMRSQTRLDDVLEADPRLQALRASLECVAIVPSGVVLGFHRPRILPDPTRCGS